MPQVFVAQAAVQGHESIGVISMLHQPTHGCNTPDKTYHTADGKFAASKYGYKLTKKARESAVYRSIGGGGFAWAREVYAQAKQDGCTVAVVKRIATGETYVADFATIDRYGIPRNHAGYGAQIVLPFRYWCINGQPSEAEKDAERIAANNSQLSLFSGVA